MQARNTQFLSQVDSAVDAIIAAVGKKLVVGMPLGLGKPPELINAIYDRAVADPSLSLTILTALSLEIPSPGKGLEAKFLAPFLNRVFAGVPELSYMRALRQNTLPANVIVSEFFFKPGSFLNNAHAQQHYISSNYSHAARDVFNNGCNVTMQAIARIGEGSEKRYSLSCNPDTGPELLELLEDSGRPHFVVGLVNTRLPFMVHDAEVPASTFDIIIDDAAYHSELFSTPKQPVTTPDYCIGLYASSLIKDGGTLQIGIGALGDAIVYATQLRHQNNAVYRQALSDVGATQQHSELIERVGGQGVFDKGLYGATEMFVDGFLHLMQAGILRREVYDFWALQQLVNDERIDPQAITPAALDALESLGVRVIRTQDFQRLQYHGFFNDATRYDSGYLIAPDGTRVIANVAEPYSRKVIGEQCLGTALKNGIVLHGGFFLGPRSMYQAIHDMTPAENARICMTGVNKVNQLDLNPRLYKAQRIHARFMNTGIMATLSGALVSDGLADGRVISGVGGQYNFVAMAHQLPTGRSILMVRSVRDGAHPSSNIVMNYGHITIPRHLRDIVISEYGIAELRSKSDADVIKALLNIADSRFQEALLSEAKASGKVEANYVIPDAHCQNFPAALEQKLDSHRQAQRFPAFPLGSDLTPEELRLGAALKVMKKRAESTPKWRLLLALLSFKADAIEPSLTPLLERMGLTTPQSMQDKVAQMLLIEALSK
ncbi:MAG: acetyl-CoA hydrolase/transferase C-terminal domain-containing protein [Paraperlucidibaca sp.]